MSTAVTTCSTCASLRLDLRHSRHELAHIQRTTEELQREVAKMEAMEHTLWTDNAAQLREIHELRAAVEQLQHAQPYTDDQIRAPEQPAHATEDAETQTCSLSDSASRIVVAETAVQCSLLQPTDDNAHDALVKRAAALANQVASLEQALAARALQNDCTATRLREVETLLLQERAAHDALCTRHRERELHFGHRTQELEQLLADAQRDAAAATARSASDVARLDELTRANASLATQLASECGMSNELEERYRSLGLAVESSYARAAVLSSDLAQASVLLATAKTENAQLASDAAALRHFIEELQQQIQFGDVERARIEAEVATWRAAAEQQDANSHAEATRLTQTLASVRDECVELQTLVETLERDHEAFVIRLKAAHATALERALHAAIRLCVVAPTVNVHLSDADSSTGSTESSTVVCKPSAPREQIRDVVETKILPLFTRLVAQRDGDSAAVVSDGGLEPWVHELLHSMQRKITEQLRDVYRTNTA